MLHDLIMGIQLSTPPPFFTQPSTHKAELSYHCAWSEFYLELHMLLQPPLKARCWCLASLGPLTIKRGATLSLHCLLWAYEVKRQKCEIMNEWLAVYWRLPQIWNEKLHLMHAFWKRTGGYFVSPSAPLNATTGTPINTSAKERLVGVAPWPFGICLLFLCCCLN